MPCLHSSRSNDSLCRNLSRYDKHEILVNFFLDRYLEHVFEGVAVAFLIAFSGAVRFICGLFSPYSIIFIEFLVLMLPGPSLEVDKVRGIIPVVVMLMGGACIKPMLREVRCDED